MHVCACETDDVEALLQRPLVRTRHVNNTLHVCMSVMYMPNVAHMNIDVYVNCKPSMIV